MSNFSKKIFSGKPASDEDWNQYLHDAHQKMPGMTEHCFADHPTDLGPNTYEIFSRQLDRLRGQQLNILDLACGDGHLLPYVKKHLGDWNQYFGVDMVESEIQIATRKYGNDSTKFVCAKAQALPFQNGQFDIVVCHLALMLMLPLDPVLQEISRVLKPAGLFICGIGRQAARGGLFSVMGEKTSSFVQSELSKAARFRTGDERLNDLETLKKLFSSHSLPVQETLEYWMKMTGSPEKLWDGLQHFYVINILPETSREQLKKMLLSDLSDRSKNGTVELELPELLITAKRT